jgi:hypothetical protein
VLGVYRDTPQHWPLYPLRQWGFRQCLPFSWTTLRGEHCRHPIAVMGVVDTFEHELWIHCEKIFSESASQTLANAGCQFWLKIF